MRLDDNAVRQHNRAENVKLLRQLEERLTKVRALKNTVKTSQAKAFYEHEEAGLVRQIEGLKTFV